MKDTYEMLAYSALAARAAAYSPYSGFSVGAAVLAESGKVYLGANVENAAYGETVCAERVAILKAVSEGERRIVAVAVAGGGTGEEAKEYFPPCGSCRQVMAEFGGRDLAVILASEGGFEVHSLGEMLPFGFDKEQLGKESNK